MFFLAGRAVLDTCVLYPASVRDTLLTLAEAELYQPVWSPQIVTELADNLNRRNPPPDVARLLSHMTAAFDDALVTGYKHLVEDMTCDPKDRHVLALAVHADAGAVVTANLADFPPESTVRHGVVAVSPDDFALELFALAPSGTELPPSGHDAGRVAHVS